MPNAPKNKHRMVRFSDWDWHAFGWLAGRRDKDRSVVLRELAHWWMRVPGATLPERPTIEDARGVPELPSDSE